MPSKYLPAPTRAQRWTVRHGRAIRISCAVFVVAVLVVQALAVVNAEATAVTWVSAFTSVLVAVGVATSLLPNVQRYVTRWDANHDDGHT